MSAMYSWDMSLQKVAHFLFFFLLYFLIFFFSHTCKKTVIKCKFVIRLPSDLAHKEYKAHLNWHQISLKFKQRYNFSQKWHQYVVAPKGQTAYHKQLKIGKCINIEPSSNLLWFDRNQRNSYRALVPLVWYKKCNLKSTVIWSRDLWTPKQSHNHALSHCNLGCLWSLCIISGFLQVLAIDFVPLANEFVPLAIEFVTLAFEFRRRFGTKIRP